MNHAVILPGGVLKLQATLASSTSGSGGGVSPHHPITCTGDLRLQEDGSLQCNHSWAPPGDIRTQFCIDQSISLLLMELSAAL